MKCNLHLSCVVHGPIYGRFMGCAVNGSLFTYKVYLWPMAYAKSDLERFPISPEVMPCFFSFYPEYEFSFFDFSRM